MSRTQRTIAVGLWGLVVLSLIGLLSLLAAERRQARVREAGEAAREEAIARGTVVEITPDGRLVPSTQRAELTFDAPTFALTDQNSQSFDASQLKGKVWTAMFFFSHCTGVCPSMTERIVSLQKVTDDPRVHCVSFTADPERDTPERLKKYAEQTKADESRWHLLTGEASEMKRIALGFKLPFDQPMDHSAKIMLVDQAGVVRGYYESQSTDEMFKLTNDIKDLLGDVPATTQPAVADSGASR